MEAWNLASNSNNCSGNADKVDRPPEDRLILLAENLPLVPVGERVPDVLFLPLNVCTRK
tara:strand:+ start:105 stop:281 length:177 start_codon:yes stop_codon:yes gene_type:complete